MLFNYNMVYTFFRQQHALLLWKAFREIDQVFSLL